MFDGVVSAFDMPRRVVDKITEMLKAGEDVPYIVKGSLTRFDPKTSKFEFFGNGDAIKPTPKELELYPERFLEVKAKDAPVTSPKIETPPEPEVVPEVEHETETPPEQPKTRTSPRPKPVQPN